MEFYSTLLNICCVYEILLLFNLKANRNAVVAYLYYQMKKHLMYIMDLLRQRANAQNVSSRISFRWPIHIINPVDKTKLSCMYIMNKFMTTLVCFPVDYCLVVVGELACLSNLESYTIGGIPPAGPTLAGRSKGRGQTKW